MFLAIILLLFSQCERGRVIADKAKLVSSSGSTIERTYTINFVTCNHGLLSFRVLQSISYANRWYEIKYETDPVSNLIYIEPATDTICKPYN